MPKSLPNRPHVFLQVKFDQEPVQSRPNRLSSVTRDHVYVLHLDLLSHVRDAIYFNMHDNNREYFPGAAITSDRCNLFGCCYFPLENHHHLPTALVWSNPSLDHTHTHTLDYIRIDSM